MHHQLLSNKIQSYCPSNPGRNRHFFFISKRHATKKSIVKAYRCVFQNIIWYLFVFKAAQLSASVLNNFYCDSYTINCEGLLLYLPKLGEFDSIGNDEVLLLGQSIKVNNSNGLTSSPGSPSQVKKVFVGIKTADSASSRAEVKSTLVKAKILQVCTNCLARNALFVIDKAPVEVIRVYTIYLVMTTQSRSIVLPVMEAILVLMASAGLFNDDNSNHQDLGLDKTDKSKKVLNNLGN